MGPSTRRNEAMSDTDPTAHTSAEDALSDARRHLHSGSGDTAEACLRRAVELDGAHAEALFLLGALLREQGGLQEASALLERAATQAPEIFDNSLA